MYAEVSCCIAEDDICMLPGIISRFQAVGLKLLALVQQLI